VRKAHAKENGEENIFNFGKISGSGVSMWWDTAPSNLVEIGW
jgi:hypothetical protein